jgi:hypothetical protein
MTNKGIFQHLPKCPILRTYEKRVRNMSKMNRYKMIRLEPTQNETYKKRGRGWGRSPRPSEAKSPARGASPVRKSRCSQLATRPTLLESHACTSQQRNSHGITSLQKIGEGGQVRRSLPLFCSSKNLNLLIFMLYRTLSQKYPGWGGGASERLPAQSGRGSRRGALGRTGSFAAL